MARAFIVIVGSGNIGVDLAERLTAHCEVSLLSARRLLSMKDAELAAAIRPASIVVFAQGANVNTRSFERDYDMLVGSRIDPLVRVASCLENPLLRCVLISSTVAFLGNKNPRTLAALQIVYEDEFRRLFGKQPMLILRFGTVCTGHSGAIARVASLRRTLLVKRLRIAGGTSIPYVDHPEMQSVATLLANQFAFDGRSLVVAAKHGLNLNALLQRHVPVTWRIPVPLNVYRWIFERLGIRGEFFSVTQEMLAALHAQHLLAEVPS